MADWNSGLDDEQAGMARNPMGQLAAAGIDPDEALLDRQGAMARIGANPLSRMMDAYRAGSQQPQLIPRGAPTPAAAPATSPDVSPSGTPHDMGMSALRLMQTNLEGATRDTAQTPITDPNVDRMQQQLSQDLAKRPNAYDQETGKLRPEYAPSVGQRIARGLKGAALGLAEGGIRGAVGGAVMPEMTAGPNAGYGAPNARYSRQLAANDQALASDTQQFQTAQQRFKAIQDAIKARSGERRAIAMQSKDQATGAQQLENADTAQVLAQNQTALEYNQSPEAKLALTEGQFQQRTQRADQLGLRGALRVLFLANGKLPDPKQPNEAEVSLAEARRAEQIFSANHGGEGPKTLDDYQSILSAVMGGRGGEKTPADAERAVQAAVQKSLQDKNVWVNQYRKDPFSNDGSYIPVSGTGKSLTPAEFAAKVDKFRTDLNNKIESKGYRMNERGEIERVQPGGNGGAGLPETVMVNGRPARVVGRNPKTGKLLVTPLDQAGSPTDSAGAP